jgi:hypothetical protein
MPSCEKCWSDAGGNPDRYGQLLVERRDNPCTPEQQAGVDALVCPKCGRVAVHQHCGVCMACGWEGRCRMSEGEYITCPFCGEDDFDQIGLKLHLLCGHCGAFEAVSIWEFGEPAKDGAE